MSATRRRFGTAIAAAISVTVALAQTQSPAPPAPGATLATILPAGALLVVEARDLSSLVRGWNASTEKARWLESANYKVFSRSRLFLRLDEARGEFATAAGVPPDMALVGDIAGGASALALYGVGELELLYVTRLPAAQAMAHALWRARGSYEPREAAGTPFYVRTDPESKRVVAFGERDGYLLLATREDLLAGALALIGTRSGASVAGEGWFTTASSAAAGRGDVRLVINLGAAVTQPHFRSYWVQNNVSELKQYGAGVSDLFLDTKEVREERVLLRATEAAAPQGLPLGDVVRLVPDEAGLYRAWAGPSAATATALVVQKAIAPASPAIVGQPSAPVVALSGGVTGSSEDLEVRIDEAAQAPQATGYQLDALTRLVASAPLTALLHVESTRPVADAFVARGAVIVLARASDWPQGEARGAIATAIAPVWTKAGLGPTWREAGAGAQRYSRLDGLEPLAVAERGRLLFVATDPALLERMLAASAAPATAADGIYRAGFRHGRERERFASLTRFIDRAAAAGEEHEPLFFSENLVSLSHVLARVDSASLIVRDAGTRVTETVTYRLVQ